MYAVIGAVAQPYRCVAHCSVASDKLVSSVWMQKYGVQSVQKINPAFGAFSMKTPAFEKWRPSRVWEIGIPRVWICGNPPRLKIGNPPRLKVWESPAFEKHKYIIIIIKCFRLAAIIIRQSKIMQLHAKMMTNAWLRCASASKRQSIANISPCRRHYTSCKYLNETR